MQDSAASFEAIQKLEAPTFDQIFRNEELRREFENLTRKLDGPPSSHCIREARRAYPGPSLEMLRCLWIPDIGLCQFRDDTLYFFGPSAARELRVDVQVLQFLRQAVRL